jgi:pimeloyl-ACP methyl ester carboxylesterase
MGEKAPGRPTVILEAGIADWSGCWSLVQPEMAAFARVVSYDRAGSGWSDPGPLPRTPLQVVTELHTLLERAGEPGPYLLVGHSLGSAYMRLFASLYPAEVAGMIWVDPAHEQLGRFVPFWPAASIAMVALTRLGSLLARVGIVRLGRMLLLMGYPAAQGRAEREVVASLAVLPHFLTAFCEETIAWNRPENWAATRASFEDLPITALEARYSPQPNLWIYPRYFWRQYLHGWHAAHDDLATRSNRIRRIPVESGHAIQGEQPEIVIQAVREMLRKLNEPPDHPL